MSTPARLATFLAGLAIVFAVAFVAGRALVPEDTVADWTRQANESTEEHGESGGHGASQDHGQASPEDAHVNGLSIEQEGYRLTPVSAPGEAGETGQLSFRVLDPDGSPLTGYETNHEKDLHLIVVRSDGAGFRHVHPKLDRETGFWSLPWEWTEGGTYRVFTDFVPTGATEPLTLSRSVEVGGDFEPVVPALSRKDEVNGFAVTLAGDLKPEESRDLTATITRNGEPVTDLQPYLGAFGHLVALREGDLAYLHVHAGDEHEGGTGDGSDAHSHGQPTAGPEIGFRTEAPTPGRYLMYLDFKVAGEVHTAEFVLEAR